MKALSYDQYGGPIRVIDIARPTAPAGGAVVRVIASGLCRSDWHAWSGHDDTVSLPHIPGHEYVGIIESVGEGVRKFSPGQRVTAPFVHGCGTCQYCVSGNGQVCPHQTQPGFTHPGSHAEYVVVRAADHNLVVVPSAVSDYAAVSLGCRFATSFRALTSRARLLRGEWVAVYGAGGVGLSAVMIAAALGARTVVVDRSPDALAVAQQLGADHSIVASDDTPQTILDLTGGGAHVSVDAVGTAATAVASVKSLRRLGRHVQIGLLPHPLPVLPLDLVTAWELEVLGSHGMAAADYPAMLELVVSGTLRPHDMVTETVGMSDAARLIADAESASSAGITVLDPTRQ